MGVGWQMIYLFKVSVCSMDVLVKLMAQIKRIIRITMLLQREKGKEYFFCN